MIVAKPKICSSDTKFWQCAFTRVVAHVMTMSNEKETMTGSSEM
jgi:hypothetical protein